MDDLSAKECLLILRGFPICAICSRPFSPGAVIFVWSGLFIHQACDSSLPSFVGKNIQKAQVGINGGIFPVGYFDDGGNLYSDP